MFKDVGRFVALVFLLIAILIIFNARIIVRKKMDRSSENVKVNIVKWLGVLLAIMALSFIYYL